MRLCGVRALVFCVSFFAMAAACFAQTERSYCALHAESRTGVMRTKAAPSPNTANTDNSAEHGFPLSNLDRSVPACTNFFQYAVGGWLKANPIPAAYSSWGIDSVMANENEDTLHKILEHAKADRSATNGSAEQKIGDFYASCMDESAIEAAGAKPLEPELKRIDAMRSISDLQAEAARLQAEGVNVLFRIAAAQDEKNSTQEIAIANQGGLGLPDRDYYTKT